MDNLKLENLLKQISEIKKKNDALLDATGMRFNIFKILGIRHYEKYHTSTLAELLNPKGTHGMKDTFLKLFIKIVLADDFLFDLENKNITVRKEYTIDEGRIDIFIENSKSKQAIIIENKIFAPDQKDQLKRYASFGKKKYNGNHRILYLTLCGKEAPEQSGGGIDYKCISYKDHIIKWLEECLKVSSNSPNVNRIIFQYLNHLKQLTHQDMDTEYTKEIVKLLADNVENVESAVIIYQNFERMKLRIIEEMGNRIAEKIPKKFSDEWLFVDDNHMNGFHFAKKEWQGKAGIYFAENNKQLYFAFKNQAACTGEAEPQEKITELFDMDPIPYDPYGYKLVGPHWNYNPEILINIKDGKYEEEFVIPYLVHALEYLENHPDVEKNMCSIYNP